MTVFRRVDDTSQGDILVFAGKMVGLECVRHLLSSGYSLTHLIVGSADDQELLRLAHDHGVSCEVYGPDTQERIILAARQFQWLLSLWSPCIIRPDLLVLAQHRLNTHPGAVPECRGNDNAAWTIRKSLTPGVSLLEMVARVDRGAVYATRRLEDHFPETGLSLHRRLQEAMTQLFCESWGGIYAGRLRPHPVDGRGSYFIRSRTNADRCRSGKQQMTLENVVRWALAHDFYPGTTAELEIDKKRYRLRIALEELP